MKGKLAAANITQIINELKKISSLNKRKKDKYISKLEELHKLYINIEIDEKFKIQYNRMNEKGKEVIKELKSTKEKNKIESVIEVYTRYLTASLCDFQGKTINLRKYITSFLFCAMLFLALTPQFFGFFLPILFFIPIYIGLKGVKQRTITGFYMTMSVIPVAFMTAVTWIRYGINVKQDYVASLKMIVDSGISQNLAEILIVTGPVLGFVLFIFASIQLYQGIKTKDLFI
ncbi:hypothetical protein [Romboutsia timonensis]|uniref:hypothetical protein n=1 Tax=Romboutsia timonensis TaxID=1776391 RepID=UPI0008DAA9A5|nr:hypothetical protein [Romboutsia timonensis]